jgi:HEAT repeat protein
MGYHKWQSLYLSGILGLTAGLGLLPIFSAPIAVQADELSSQSPEDGVIKNCIGRRIELGSSQLRDADLKALTSCSSEVIPQVIESLQSHDWKVKVIAAEILGLLGTNAHSTIPVLSNLIQDDNADVRFVAARALGEIGTEAVVPDLTKALQDKDENVRVSAADAFQKIGSAAKQAKSALITALWDGNWFVRSRAAATISKLGLETNDIPAIIEPLRDIPEPDNGSIAALMLSIYPPIFNKLEDLPLFFIKGLQSKEPKVRESAALALGQVSLDRIGFVYLNESIYALKKAVEDPDSKVRLSALIMLDKIAIGPASGNYGRKKDTQVLSNIESFFFNSLHDKEADIRQIALEALDNGYDVYPNSKKSTVILAALEAIQDEDPAVRQSAFDLLSSNLGKLNSLPSLFKLQLVEKVPLALTRSLYDKDTSVRQDAWSRLEEKFILPNLVEVLQNKNIDLEIRHDAIASIAMGREYTDSIKFEQSQTLVELLKRTLKDSDIRVRVNAAHALERTGILNSKDAVPIFIDGLKSKNPSAKLHAIFALNRMCGRGNEIESRCANAKLALPELIDTLNVNIKPLQYAAALAIADIDPKEEKVVNILREVLLKESNFGLRENTTIALSKIGSHNALSTMTQSLGFDDKQSRYARTCIYMPYIPTDDNNSRTPFVKSISFLLQAIENPDVRFSASETFRFRVDNRDKNPSLSEIQFVVSELTSILKNSTIQYTDHPVLLNIFRLKGQDIRHSAIYALGEIGASLKGVDDFSDQQRNLYPQIQNKIITTLMTVVNDRGENPDIQWLRRVCKNQKLVWIGFSRKKSLLIPQLLLPNLDG